jgi:hypothetical protein
MSLSRYNGVLTSRSTLPRSRRGLSVKGVATEWLIGWHSACVASAAPRLDLGSMQCVGSVTLAGRLVSRRKALHSLPHQTHHATAGYCQHSLALAWCVSFGLLLAVHDVLSQGVNARERLLRPAPTSKHSSAVVFLGMGGGATNSWMESGSNQRLRYTQLSTYVSVTWENGTMNPRPRSSEA